MTNKEFYGDKLMAVALEIACRTACRTLHINVYGESCAEREKCGDCEFYTVENIENWLNAEHVEPEPPLLENGDGLKPGDWVMVRNRDGDKWQKRQFMCYFQSLDKPFVTLEQMHGWYVGKHECWKKARLLEEGE